MTILIAGASGFVGSALVRNFREDGYTVRTLGRSSADLIWNPYDSEELMIPPGTQTVINLAGAGLADKRWTESRKRELWDSRVLGTRKLFSAAAKGGVTQFISASAVGIYGDRGDEMLSEQSSKGTGFLAELVDAWEAAIFSPIGGESMHRVALRFGVILDESGGMLKRLLPLYRLLLGGKLGTGRQYMSWVALEDVLAIFRYVMSHNLEGVFNATAPLPVTNCEFNQVMANIAHRPAVFTVPGWVLSTLLGEVAGELLLASQRALPTRLLTAGYRFKFDSLNRFAVGI